MAVSEKDLYLGIDVGGTKILAGLVSAGGEVYARRRVATPRDGGAEEAVQAILSAIEGVLKKASVSKPHIRGIGIAVPGQVEPDSGFVLNTPNMNLVEVPLADRISAAVGAECRLGNDVRVGMLGEKWLGAARSAETAVGIFIGTGIGGGIISHGLIERGARGIAGEVGHIIMQPGGPLCGCGNRGCFEALASRSAMERRIAGALAEGRRSVVTDLLDTEDNLLKGKVLRAALEAGDELVGEVVRDAAHIIALACLTVRHLVDPDVIVLGGGVIEACGRFMMPEITSTVQDDLLPAVRPGGRVVQAELGDDAVLLGAVALARGFGRTVPAEAARAPLADYPRVEYIGFGEVRLGRDVINKDFYIRADGRVKTRKKKRARAEHGSSHIVGPRELERICKGRPGLLVIGAGRDGLLRLDAAGEEYLEAKGIEFKIEQSAEAARIYNAADCRRALLMHVTC